MDEKLDPKLDPGVEGALFDYLQDVDDYVERLRSEANRALTRAVRQASSFGWSQRRIAAAVGRSQPEVARLLRATQPVPVLVDYALGDPHGTEVAAEPVAEPVRERQRPSSTLTWVLRDKREDIVRIAEARGARNVRVFGSVARGEDDQDSDIDLLVDLDAGVGLFDISGLQLELEAELGRPVDVSNARALMPRVARHALPEAVAL